MVDTYLKALVMETWTYLPCFKGLGMPGKETEKHQWIFNNFTSL